MEHQGAGNRAPGEDLLSSIALNDNKAGMEGLDRDKINKIILEASKGSRFYENELKKDRQMSQRIEKMMEQKVKITEEQMKQAQAEVDKLTSELERRRELDRVIVHVDMDAFYAAVEMKDCPELKDKPMAVGSMSMLSTSNYHARRFGVRAAMPGFIAKKLCPNLVIVPTNFDKYRAVSSQVREIFSDYDPHFMPVSLDEAYLDITEHLEQREHWPESMRTHYMCDAKKENTPDMPAVESEKDGLSPVLFEDSPDSSSSLSKAAVVFGTSAEEAVREMRFRIEQKTSLTASAGIAPNMMLAKVCSDKNKPNGQYRIPPEREVVMDFIKDLPVRKVSGVGKVTEKMLAALGIVSCSQLGQEMALLSLLFSETSWHHFLHISLGLGSTHIERDSERKSMSTERTFGEMSDADEQYSLCRELCHDLAQDLQKEGLKGKTVTLKLKNVKFEVKTRAFTLQYAVCTEDEIFAAAKDLLKVEIDSVSPQPLRLRLMGVRVSSFISVEDKKPLQRSIMGFLQKGGPDPSSTTQCPGSTLKAEASSDAKSSGSHLKPLSNETNVPSVPERKSKGHQQQSFFQKAQTKRLQQQHQTFGDAVTTDTAMTNNTAGTAAATQTDLSITNRQSDTASAGLSNRDTTGYMNKQVILQTSFDNTSTQCLTCPVCNREMKAVNLVTFNHHIDACLEGNAMNEATDMDTDLDECSEAQEKQKTLSLSSSGSRALLQSSKEPSCDGKEEKPSISILVPVVDNDESSDFRTPFFSRRTNVNKKEIPLCESSCKASHVSHTPEVITALSAVSKGPSLTCPVCSQPQSTDDLTLFNRHVDMCLNREVLLEFRGSDSSLDHSDAQAHRGQMQDQGRVSKVREKNKRQGSSALPPAKKMLETEKEFIEAAKRSDVDGMKLLGRGINVNAKNVHGRTALHYAVAFKNIEAVDMLLRRRAKLDLQDKHGLTAIHLAAWFGSLEILKLLVQGGADQSIENTEGMNMMHCAAMNNHTDIVEYIVDDLQMGELDKEDTYGNRPFALAAAHGCVRMLQMLMEEPYNMATIEENKDGDTPLHLAAKSGQREALQLLLDNFDIRNEVNQAGQTALYLAADEAHEDCVQTLLEADCDPNIFTLTRSSPLHPVCETGNFPIVKLLIESGAQLNAQNQHLETPFHLAVKNGHIPVIHTLLEAGCDPNVTDHMGQTALHIAAEMGKVDVVEMILKAEVDLEIQDRQGKTALGVAARGNMVVVVDMISKAERYFRWKRRLQMTNTDALESLHSESPLTFKLDHSPDTKQVRGIIWDLAYKHLKRNEWKKLAEVWEFTEAQVAAIEEQWTGPNSFQEHGNRMFLIWLHEVMTKGKSPVKGLYEGLLSAGNTKIAEKIRMEGTNDTRKCTVS